MSTPDPETPVPTEQPATAGLRPTDLVEHGAAIRALLRTMVREQDIDDLLQETWLRAMTTRSVRRGRLRAWLKGIATNLARDHRRRGARAARARSGVAPGSSPPTDEVVVELEGWRELGSAVEHLAEPYRSTIVLRYFRGWTMEAIAERDRTTTGNVRQRLRRGLEQLRVRVDRGGRDRLAALLPALPFVPARRVFRPAHAALAMLSLGGLVWGTLALGGGSSTAGTPRLASAARSPSASASTAAPAERVAVAPPARRQSQDVGPPSVVVRGVTLDARGTPVPAIELCAWTQGVTPRPDLERPLGVSDEAGRFSVEVSGPGVLIGTRDAAALWRGAVVRAAAADTEGVVVVAEPVEVAGQVLGADDAPAAGAELLLRREPLRAFPRRLAGCFTPGTLRVAVDDDGRFALRAPAGPAAVLSVRAGEAAADRAVPDRSRSDLVLRLESPAMLYTVEGVVRGPDGGGVPGARVGLAGHAWQARTDSAGRYRFEVGSGRAPRDAVALYAVAEGLAPAVAASFSASFWLASGSQSFAHDFTLEPPLPPLRGRVLDAAGAPLAGVRVRPWDAMPLAADESRAVEDIAAAGEGAVAVTGADGRFALTGLAARGYRLVCTVPGGRWPLITREDWRPGAHAVIRFAAAGVLHDLSGIVRDHRGRPLAAVRVAGVMGLRSGLHDGAAALRAWVGSTQSGPDGVFILHDVPRDGVRLVIDRPGHLPLEVGSEATRVGHLPDLVLPAIAGLRGEGLSSAARWVRLLDEAGARCRLACSDPGPRTERDTWPVRGGRFEVLDAAPGPRVAQVLDSRHRELQRHPVLLREGRIEVVRGND